MKKIVLFLAALACFSAASAQFVLGVQGGYYTHKASNSENKEYTSETNWLAGGQLGYMVTPRLYVGVSGGYVSTATESLTDHDSLFYKDAPFPDNKIPVINLKQTYTRTGWEVCPIVKYEFVRFGNMHFNVMLQGTFRSMGSTIYKRSFTTLLFPNPLELRDEDPEDDHITYFSWGVSLKPTVVYEFTPHMSLEVMLDFLSIGYIDVTETQGFEAEGFDDVKSYNRTFYAGANTLTETLRWESPLLKVGFNYTF